MTTLNLLTREGVVTVTFFVELKPRHYAELHDVACSASESKATLCEQLASLSHRWGSKIEMEGC